MTNSWTDIRNTDLVVIMGGNAAEAHPCGFKWVTEAKANRGAKLIVVDPRFTRSASVADFYAPIRQGTDIAFLLGVINYCIKNDKVQWEYVKAFTNAAYHREGRLRLQGRPVHRLRRGKARLRQVDLGIRDRRRTASPWSMTRCSNPRCVWNLLKAARRDLHARNGRAHLRHAEGQVPEGLPR